MFLFIKIPWLLCQGRFLSSHIFQRLCPVAWASFSTSSFIFYIPSPLFFLFISFIFLTQFFQITKCMNTISLKIQRCVEFKILHFSFQYQLLPIFLSFANLISKKWDRSKYALIVRVFCFRGWVIITVNIISEYLS